MPLRITKEQATELTKKAYPLTLIAIAILFVILLLSIVRTAVFGEVDHNKYLLFEISFLLLIAVLAEIGVIHSKQPSAILLLLIGVIMSQSVLGFNLFKDESVIHIFAQLGAIFLLFRVGLHSHIRAIFSMENLVVALLGVVLPFLGGFAYASATGGNFVYSMFLGAALTATSVGVSVAIIKEAGLMDRKFAQVIIGAAVIDDVLGLLVLSFVLNIPTGYELPQIITLLTGVFSTGLTPEFLAFVMPIGKIAASAMIFLVGGIVAGRWIVRNIIDKLEMTNANFLVALALLMLYAYVAEIIGLSAIVGAFLAGLLLTSSKYVKGIEEKVYPLEIIFVPVFFISLGLLVNANDLIVFAVPITIISIIAIATKLLGCGIGAIASGMNKLDSTIIGIGMAPRAEVALIVASIGLQSAALNASEYAIIAAMALVTTLIPPFFMNYFISKVKN